jgi:hypothetical protein
MAHLVNKGLFDSPINLDDVKHHIDSLPAALSILDQTNIINIIFVKIDDKSLYFKKAIVKILIDSGRIDFKNVLKQRDWLCNFSTTDFVLRDEGISASIRETYPDFLEQCNTYLLENKMKQIERFRIVMSTDIEAPSKDKIIRVPVCNFSRTKYKPNAKYDKVDVRIDEIGECQFEMTEAVITQFYSKLKTLKKDKYMKEVLHYSLPSLFPTESPIEAISEENPLKSNMAHWEQLKQLNDPRMDIMSRRAKLGELSTIIDTVAILELISLSYKMIKLSQTVKVEFPTIGKFGYYVLHNCSINEPINIADSYIFQEDNHENIFNISPFAPQISNVDGVDVLKSELPDYSLPQISAINSWITHGLLSVFFRNSDFLKSICTNPFIGNEDFWGYIQDMMQRQFIILYSASKPLAADTLLYRGSPEFKEEPVRKRTIIATSKQPNVANLFSMLEESLAKKIIVPAGTHVIDLSPINMREEEVLIFPSGDSNLLIEPLELLRNKTKRNTYRIRNINKAGGGGKRRQRKTRRK